MADSATKDFPLAYPQGPKFFQRRMSQLLSGVPGVICDIDDILISGRSQEEHDKSLEEVLQRLETAGVTLNDKCAFSQASVKFLGHVLSREGLSMDPAKVEAIKKLARPENVPEQ